MLRSSYRLFRVPRASPFALTSRACGYKQQGSGKESFHDPATTEFEVKSGEKPNAINKPPITPGSHVDQEESRDIKTGKPTSSRVTYYIGMTVGVALAAYIVTIFSYGPQQEGVKEKATS